jgi:SAM-dependent methyltransferase
MPLDQVTPPETPNISAAAFEAVAARERVSARYWARTDPIREQRVFWRAQTVRHMLHLLPGEEILELTSGTGGLTQMLAKVTRGECPITAATFAADAGRDTAWAADLPGVERVELASFPGPLAGRAFDYVVATNLLDHKYGPALLREVMGLLKPGGRLVFFETNPWNPAFRLRRMLARVLPFLRHGDERELLNQVQLYELFSELGFIRTVAICYDFLYSPLPKPLMMLGRNLSLVLENTPGLRRMAGAIVLQAQRPPADLPRPPVRMTEHRNLHDAVSVVVPCYNEEMNLIPLVRGLLEHYDEYIHEIVLVDDNSRDRSRAVMEQLSAAEPRVRPVFRTPPNGVGSALRDGLARASGRYVLMMDCDFLHILPELREMFDAAARGSDLVLGSRFSRQSVLINYPWTKIVCNRSFHLLMMLLFHRKLRDVTNNLKLFSRPVADDLEITEPWFAANAETGLKPILMGYEPQLVPISWINRTPEMGQSSFSLVKNGIGYLRVLLGLAWRTRFGFRPLPRRAAAAAPAPPAEPVTSHPSP